MDLLRRDYASGACMGWGLWDAKRRGSGVFLGMSGHQSVRPTVRYTDGEEENWDEAFVKPR